MARQTAVLEVPDLEASSSPLDRSTSQPSLPTRTRSTTSQHRSSSTQQVPFAAGDDSGSHGGGGRNARDFNFSQPVPCFFDFLNCDRAYTSSKAWREHCNTHIDALEPPSRVICFLCFERPGSWLRFLDHTADHLRNGENLADTELDRSLLQYLQHHKLVGDADLALLRLPDNSYRRRSDLRTFDRTLDTKDVELVYARLRDSFDQIATGKYEWMHEIKDTGYDLRELAEVLVEDRQNHQWIATDQEPPADRQMTLGRHFANCVHTMRNVISPQARSADERGRDRPNSDLKPLDFSDVEDDDDKLPHLPEEGIMDSPGKVKYLRQATDPPSELVFLHALHAAHTIASEGKQPPIVRDFATALSQSGILPRTAMEQAQFRRSLDMSCSLAAKTPHQGRQAQNDWLQATFSKDLKTLSVVYRESPMSLIMDRLKDVCAAIAALQYEDLCCDSITYIRNDRRMSWSISTLFLERLGLDKVKILLQCARRMNERPSDTYLWTKLSRAAHAILSTLQDKPGPGDSDVELPQVLHDTYLAAQFLTIAVRSYSQGHKGALDIHFLATLPEQMVLRGYSTSPASSRILIQLEDLACLGVMIGGPVLTFSYATSEGAERWSTRSTKYNLCAHIEDLIDTYGPGSVVFRSAKDRTPYPVAISLLGGYIHTSKNGETKGHWSPAGEVQFDELEEIYNPAAPIVIGAPVGENPECPISEEKCRKNHQAYRDTLGVRKPYWQTSQRQVAGSGGQYVVAQFSQTWAKVEGVSIKQNLLGGILLPVSHFLEHRLAVRISICTAVAQRVSLRDLLADLLPIFTDVAPLNSSRWNALQRDHDALHYIGRSPKRFAKWYKSLPSKHQDFFSQQVLCILRTLESTGINTTSKLERFTIAWPTEANLLHCIRVPLTKENTWLHLFADSTDCATFAYATPRCLEADHVRCTAKFTDAQMILSLRCVATAVSPDLSTAPSMPEDPGKLLPLRDTQGYHVEKMEQKLYVKLVRPYRAKYVHVVPEKSRIPERIWRRLVLRKKWLTKIREQGMEGEDAQSVFVGPAVERE